MGKAEIIPCAGACRRAVRDLGIRVRIGLNCGNYPDVAGELCRVELRAWRAECLYASALYTAGVGDGWRAYRALALAFRAECRLLHALHELQGAACDSWGFGAPMRWGVWARRNIGESVDRSNAALFALGENARELVPVKRVLRMGRNHGVAGLYVGVAGQLRGCVCWAGAGVGNG